jgi:catechol 2,3-dioxygenase-like lactoylglutathione lyase family enzyme
MIHHITCETPPERVDACLRFYTILGFDEVVAPPGIARRAVWLERSSGDHATQVHLMPTGDATPSSGHFGVICRDYGDTLAELRRAGFEPEPRTEHWGSPRSYVRDPAGNRVEVMAWPPAPQASSDHLPPRPQ